MRVAHVLKSKDKKQGGLSQSVPKLSEALSKMIESNVFVEKNFKFLPKHINIIHLNGVWDKVLYKSYYISRIKNIPYVISTRGLLEPWCLKYHKLRKKIARVLYADRIVKNASCIHATCEQEHKSLRKLGFKNPIAVIPNGVNIQNFKKKTPKDIIFKKFPELENKKIILFLSRIHKIKGIYNLAHAWNNLSRKFPNWHLIITGPDEDNHTKKIRRMIYRGESKDNTTFTGPLYGKNKNAILDLADCFVLPTFSESFGIVVAEALACKTPVITTKKAPWGDLERNKCGWWIDIGIKPLEKAMVGCFSMSNKERERMGSRGKKIVKEKYTWDKIAVKMKKVYEWVLDQRKKPNFVYTLKNTYKNE